MHIYKKTNAHLHRQKTTVTLTLTHIRNPYPYPNLYFNPKQPYPDLNPDFN